MPAGVNAPGYNGSAHRAGALRGKTQFGQVEAIDLNRPQAVRVNRPYLAMRRPQGRRLQFARD